MRFELPPWVSEVECACGRVVFLTHGQTACANCQAANNWGRK